MKIFTNNVLIALSLILFSISAFSQDFILLAEDIENDQSPNHQDDLKAVWYAIDEANDSLWFKIQYFEATPSGDLGLVFGIDTNLVADDGLTWDGGNQSLKPDVVFTINHVFFSGPFYGYSNHDFYFSTRIGDDDLEIIVNIKLSELDDDGKFNFILGGSQFDINETFRPTYDQLPDNGNGYIAFPPEVNGLNEVAPFADKLQFSPNPVHDFFEINHPESGWLTVSDTNGRQVFAGKFAPGQRLDCSGWEAGFYTVLLETTSGLQSGKFLVL